MLNSKCHKLTNWSKSVNGATAPRRENVSGPEQAPTGDTGHVDDPAEVPCIYNLARTLMNVPGDHNTNGQLFLAETGDYCPDTQHPLWELRCLCCGHQYRTAACAAPRRHCFRCQPDAFPEIDG